MDLFISSLEKLKEFDKLHSSHLSSSGTIFSSVRIPSQVLSNSSPVSFLLQKIKEKDRKFFDIFQTFLANFSLIDSQYLKIYQKFLGAVFRNGSYQNCIKELIKNYNDLVGEFNALINEFDILIRVKTYQDLEMLPDDYLTYFEKKLDAYLKNIKDIKLQRNSKYLKLVKKTEFNKKPVIFQENRETRRDFYEKKQISLKKILQEFQKIYDGDDQLNESVVEDIISQKLKNESYEIKRTFLNNIEMNYKEIIKEDFKEIETFLKKISFEYEEKPRIEKVLYGETREINKNLYREFFEQEKEKILDFPLQMTGKTLENGRANKSVRNKSNFDDDDLNYSKSMSKSNFIRKTEDNLNLSFQNISINNENSNARENAQDFMKKRRKRSERLKQKENS